MNTGDWEELFAVTPFMLISVSGFGCMRLDLGTEVRGLYMAYWADILRWVPTIRSPHSLLAVSLHLKNAQH